jgi:cation transport ATPase
MIVNIKKTEVEMKTHLDVVGLIDLITGTFFTALGVLVSLNGVPLWRPEDAMNVFVVVLVVSGVFLAVGIPSLIAGVGLLKKKRWARVVAMVVAIVALIGFPVGTGAGIYTLWVLTRTETEQLLSPAV